MFTIGGVVRLTIKHRNIIKENIISYFLTGKEKQAIQVLYKDVFPQVRYYLLQNKGDEQQAEDIFHDGMIKMIIKIRNGSIDEHTDAFAYLFTACRNAWYTKVKRDQKVRYEEVLQEGSIDQVPTAEEIYFDQEKKSRFDEVLHSLGERCEQLLKLTFYLDHSLKEAAEILGLSGADVAKTYQYRCRKKLVEKVKNDKSLMVLMRG